MTSRPANPEELERLRRLRDGGHLRYVLLHGVVGWGVCTAVLFSLIMSLWEKEPFLKVLSGAVVAFGAGGILFGETMWRAICRRCDRLERGPPA